MQEDNAGRGLRESVAISSGSPWFAMAAASDTTPSSAAVVAAAFRALLDLEAAKPSRPATGLVTAAVRFAAAVLGRKGGATSVDEYLAETCFFDDENGTERPVRFSKEDTLKLHKMYAALLSAELAVMASGAASVANNTILGPALAAALAVGVPDFGKDVLRRIELGRGVYAHWREANPKLPLTAATMKNMWDWVFSLLVRISGNTSIGASPDTLENIEAVVAYCSDKRIQVVVAAAAAARPTGEPKEEREEESGTRKRKRASRPAANVVRSCRGCDALKNELAIANGSIRLHATEKTELRTALHALQMANVTLRGEKDQVEARFLMAQREAGKLRRDNEAAEADRATNRRDKEAAELLLAQARADCEKLRREKEAAGAELARVRDDYERLLKSKEQARLAHAHDADKEKIRQEMKKAVSKLQADNNRLRRDKEEAESELVRARTRCTKLSQCTQARVRELEDNVRVRTFQAEEKDAKIEHWSRANHALNSDKLKLEEDKVGLQSSLQSLRSQLRVATADIQKLETEQRQLQSAVRSMQGQEAALTAADLRILDLERQIQDGERRWALQLNQMQAERDQARAEGKKAVEDRRGVMEDLEQAKTEVEMSREECYQLAVNHRALENELSVVSQELESYQWLSHRRFQA